MENNGMILPPGFQFDPTDEELIIYFLNRRAASLPCYPNIIPDLDIYAADPWDLKDRALKSEKGWCFFSRLKQNKSTRKGFWKEAAGLSDEPIFTSGTGYDGCINEVGIKKYLVFYVYGDDDDEEEEHEVVGSEVQTNFIMEEYHLLDAGLPTTYGSRTAANNEIIQDTNEWVLCRVHEANDHNIVDSQERNYNDYMTSEAGVELSYLDETFLSMVDDEDDQEVISNFPS